MKEWCQMLEPRQCRRAGVLEDKVLILGREKPFEDHGVLDSVLKFDLIQNEC